MPECRKCGENLIWKKPYKKGDIPIDPNGKTHYCRDKNTKHKFTKNDYIKCPLCPKGQFGFCLKDEIKEQHPEVAITTISEHKRMWHSQNEILSLDDFRMK